MQSPATILKLSEVEAEHIRNAFALLGGNMSRCADALGIDRRTMYRKAKALGLRSWMPQGRPPRTEAEARAAIAELTEKINRGELA